MDERPLYDVVIVGAGFAGMYALHKIRDQLGLSAHAFEMGDGVGGTWYWNRYPGARCDIESIDYSYTFSEELYRNWTWSERYPTQPEIERYANYVADTLDLRRDISFGARVVAAAWDDAKTVWTVEVEPDITVRSRFLVAASGCLSARQEPDIRGRELFSGEIYHTGAWPKSPVDLTGKQVGVIGTGSSGVQAIPMIAVEAGHLTVFQRTANFSLPAGQTRLDPALHEERKGSLKEWREAAWKAHTAVPTRLVTNRSVLEDTREDAFAKLDDVWGRESGFALLGLYNDITKNEESNRVVSDFIREKIRAIVVDPVMAEALCPDDHPFGTKRVILDTHYFATYNRPNVSLVNVRTNPIATLTLEGLRLEDGTEFVLDVLVFATGFDAMTGPLNRIDIRGRQGVRMKDAWSGGPGTYLGIQVAGFPNLFTLTGPGSPSVLCSMIFAIEQHVDWVADCLTYMRDRGYRVVEPTNEAQEQWVVHVGEVAGRTLYPKANSWYLGANIPGKPRVFMPYVGGMPAYKAVCDEVVAAGYRGFEFS